LHARVSLSSPEPRAAVILQHEPTEGPGLLGIALERAGFSLTCRLREVLPDDVHAPLVVVLGGPMGVYDADRLPFLSAEQQLLQRRLDRDLPCVGVCLGAQLLAAAAGARVFRGHAGLELGVLPVRRTPAGAQDPVFGALPETLDVAQWHQDTFDPIPGAVRLASSDRYPEQAFRLGKSYGVQFHPEVSAGTLEEWLKGAPADVADSGATLEELLSGLPRLEAARPATERFLGQLAVRMWESAP
jgi:GMP synthase (glutamine-hydrolysing)